MSSTSPSSRPLQQHASDYTSRDRHSTDNGDSHKAFFGDFIIYEAPQTARLHVAWLMI